MRSNGGGGKLKGVELGITQPIWGGFGLQANYTYSDATLDSGDPFPGNSKNTYNFTGFFENDLRERAPVLDAALGLLRDLRPHVQPVRGGAHLAGCRCSP